jgi:uncharacterized protein (DUF2267 family)
MDDRFLATAHERAPRSADGARRAARTTLRTSAHRIATGEASDIGERLPDELPPRLEPDGARARFDVDELPRRVADGLGVTRRDAAQQAGALLTTWRPAEGEDERPNTAAQLAAEDRILPRHG